MGVDWKFWGLFNINADDKQKKISSDIEKHFASLNLYLEEEKKLKDLERRNAREKDKTTPKEESPS